MINYAALSVLPFICALRLEINCCNKGFVSTSALLLLYSSTSCFCVIHSSTLAYQSLPGLIRLVISSPCSHHWAIMSPVFEDGINDGLPINNPVRSFDTVALCFVSNSRL